LVIATARPRAQTVIMKTLRRLSIAALFALGLSNAVAQAPPAVPALPDSPRLTTYSISASTCGCAVNFTLYGNANLADYQDWLEVYLNGVQVAYNDPTYGWTITSPTGALASIARPITDAVLTFTGVQTGTVEIVGASRPARLSQWSEGQGVSARNLNVAFTGIVAQLREVWDKINDVSGRDLKSQPGNTVGPLPLPAACVGAILGFDSTGLKPLCYSPLIGLGTVIGPATTTIGDLATWSSTNGGHVQDSPAGAFVLSALSNAVNAANGLVSPSNGVGTAGRLLVDQGASAPAWETVSGDCSFSSAGAITCLDTNGTAFGTFATQNYATPPPIGGTTPNAGAFNSLSDTNSQNASTSLPVTNTNAGASALASIGLTSNAGYLSILATSTANGGGYSGLFSTEPGGMYFATSVSSIISFQTNSITAMTIDTSQNVVVAKALKFVNIADSVTAPTISSGCGGGTPTISAPNGTAAFVVTIGTASGSTCAIAMPTATTGWVCFAEDTSNHTTANSRVAMSLPPAASLVTVTDYSDITGAATWVSGAKIAFECRGY